MPPAPQSRIPPILLLIVGVAIFAAFRIAYHDDRALFPNMLAAQLMFLPVVLAISFIRPVQQTVLRAIDRVRHPSRKAKLFWTIFLAGIAFIYLWRAALLHDRDLSPRLQDEFSYLIQAQLLSHGKLWLPSPFLADFFETFHVIVKPVYASVYFPGTAMLYVPSVWLHAPHYWTTLLICAVSVGLIYLLAMELFDGTYGILAALMLLATRAFYIHSTLALSNVPAMVAGMVVYLAWLKWEKTDRARIRWAILIGAASGWGLIVRPLDMIAYLVPIVCLALTSILSRCTGRGSNASSPSPGTPGEGSGEGVAVRRSIVVAVLSALPFVTIQLLFNKGVTESFLTTPYRAYFDDFQPNTGLGFAKDDPAAHPKTTLQQKHDLYDRFLRPLLGMSRIEMFTRWRIKFTTFATLPSDLLLILIPVGAFAVLRDRRRVVCLLTPILFVALYALYPYYMTYYALAIAPCVVILALSGAQALVDFARRSRSLGNATNVFVMCAIAAICLAALPETRLDFGEELDAIPGLGNINQMLPLRARPPAVVLFAYTADASPHEEPVYNYDVANPLDAPIVRAQDLGELRKREIIDYFAQRRPQTNFYRFDRGRRQLQSLGTAEDLAARGAGRPNGAPTSAPATSP